MSNHSVKYFPRVLRAVQRALPNASAEYHAETTARVIQHECFHIRPDDGAVVFQDGCEAFDARLQPMPPALDPYASEADRIAHADQVSRLTSRRIEMNRHDDARTSAEAASAFADDDKSDAAKDARAVAMMARMRAEGLDV